MPMSAMIDCLIIGHNEMDFREYEQTIRQTDKNSGAYRDLNMNFLCYNKRPYHATEVFNLFCRGDRPQESPIPPLALADTFSATIAYLGTYLDKHGFTFDYVHSFQGEKEKLAEKLKRENILTIAITTTLYVSFFPIVEIIEFARKYNDRIKIIVGGPFVSTKVRMLAAGELNYLFETMGADFYINSSQGEATLVKLLHALKGRGAVDRLNNIHYKTAGGYAAAPVIRENNRLSENIVNWELFSGDLGEYASVRTAVSCPFSCAFCGFPEHAGAYQTVGVEKVEQELNRLAKTGKIVSVNFIDDTFNIPASRYKDILRMIIKNGYRFKWHSYFRCQFADAEMVELMKASGCEGVFLGLESGSGQILKNMNKGVKLSEYYKGIELLKENGIVTYGNFIIGFPGETGQTVSETIEFIKKSGLDFYRAQSWYCEPITPIWKQRDKYRIEGESFEWAHATMNSREAAGLVEEILLNIADTVWVPQYNFDFENIWHLRHRGISMESVVNFLEAFKSGLVEKLTGHGREEMSFDVIKRLKNYRQEKSGEDDYFQGQKVRIDHSDAEFVF
jgi:radical SAM PhpK family P-methyltransferase